MNKVIKIFLYMLLIAFVVIQFIRPEKNSGGYASVMGFESETKIPKQVAAILKENCYDCHSNQTQYPWYAEVAPASYWLADHIQHGKGDLNFSRWSEYSIKKKEHKMEELFDMVKTGEMPLDSYTWIHGNLEDKEKETLLVWAQTTRQSYLSQMDGDSD